MSNTSFGITSRTELRATAAYEVFFDRRELYKLRFGLSLRPTYLNVNVNKLTDATDVDGLAQNDFFLNGSFGLTYIMNKTSFGASVRSLRNTAFDAISQDTESSTQLLLYC